MSITAGIGFVSLVTYSRSQTLTQTASDLKQAIETSRFNALSSVRPPSPACASSDQLKSYTVSFCYNSNPKCQGSDTQGTLIPPGTSYLIRVQCGSNDVLISSKKFPNGITYGTPSSGSGCQDLTFNANTAVPSKNISTCKINLILFNSVNNHLELTISQEGYVTTQ